MRFIRVISALIGIWVSTVFAGTSQTLATSLNPSIYNYYSNWPCVRLLNATGAIGCHAQHKRSGVLYHAQSQQDLDALLQGKIPSNNPYAVILGYHLFTSANMDALESNDQVSGLIILLRGGMDNASLADARSPDSTCPNCEFGLYAGDTNPYQWNPQGQGLLERSFDIPIFGIDPVDSPAMQAYNATLEAAAYNNERKFKHFPLKAIDFDLSMWAAVNAETCLRRGWCQPVGGLSVYSTPSFDISPEDQKPIVVVSSAMDSRSLFHDLTIGINYDLSGMVSVLAIADALSKVPLTHLPKHILYTLFTAETWGFAGSQRFVHDIKTPFECTNASRATACPYTNPPCNNPCVKNIDFKRIHFDAIEAIVEINSVSGTSGYWAHVDDPTTNQGLLSNLQQMNTTPGSGIRPADGDQVRRKLPPSSAMSFLAQKRDMQAAVITDYQQEMGSFYNSDLDDDNTDLNVVAQSICGLVNTTARGVYVQAGGTAQDASGIAADCELVSSLLNCLASNFSCSFMQAYFEVSGIDQFSHYASVYDFVNPQPQLLPRFALSFLMGVTAVNETRASCKTIRDCADGRYCIKGHCVRSLTNYHRAYGMGLDYDEGSGKVRVVDPTKATWTESTWSTPSYRIFLVTSWTHQVVELIVGILWLIASVLGVLFVQRWMKKTFKVE
ncbi:Nicastrin-domain-containing protein [Syncephalastrum racemosum]|uniref:Nicastrin n=1 Tax=Syncephalastrum racemosum TaxID=13706 RepID=A0A1X2GZ66_SYNRA|nr:Nicastrin-domain-containing protein [Syncephalastrum racemosum]